MELLGAITRGHINITVFVFSASKVYLYLTTEKGIRYTANSHTTDVLLHYNIKVSKENTEIIYREQLFSFKVVYGWQAFYKDCTEVSAETMIGYLEEYGIRFNENY